MEQPSRIVDTRVGPVPVRTFGDGPPVLAVHGALVDGRLWDGVATRLSQTARVIVPDLPLGAQRQAVPDRTRLNLPDLAGALVDVLDALDIPTATLLGNDSGGALSQVAAVAAPDRFPTLVLTSCDALQHFPPPLLRPVPTLLRVPGFARAFVRLFAQPWAFARPGRLNLLTRRGAPSELVDDWMAPASTNAAVRADLVAFVRSMHRTLTLDAAERLRATAHPLVLLWSRDDKIFPPADARRLAEMVPGARLVWIDEALTFSPLDQPERIAEEVAAVVTAERAHPR